MSERSVPQLCPYCAETDLRPHEVEQPDGTVTSPHGSWACRSCLRAFSLKLLGQLPRPASAGTAQS